MKKNSGNQRDKRRGIDVGSGLHQVSPVSYWYKNGHFKNEDEARGAFRLAYQQGMDGMGESVAKWMGLTEEEFSLWMSHDGIPKRALREIALNDSIRIDRWVACLDLLGIKNLIKTEYWLQVFDVYAEAIKHFKEDTFNGHFIRRITFSDSFFLYTTDGSALSYSALDSFVRYFIVSLIRHKIPVRGAMTFGKLYADETIDLYFGEALVEAYQISESQDWIGFILSQTAIERLQVLKLPANERLNYSYYQVPQKVCTEEKGAYIELPAFIIGGRDSSSDLHIACIRALMIMEKKQSDPKIKIKYLNTLEFLKKNTCVLTPENTLK
jgi:hypothetical protein